MEENVKFPSGFSPQADLQFATKAIHAGHRPSEWTTRPLVAPIVNSATFLYSKIDNPGGPYIYGRFGSPTRCVLEKTLSALEEGEFGLCFSSGLAALSAVLDLFTPQDHVICAEEIYGGSNKNMKDYLRKKKLDISFINCFNPANVERAMKPNTKLVWIETPSNPTLKMADIRAVSDIVARHPPAILVVDNTFMTPYFQKPLNHGADISMNSLTKYLNGHGDVIMGALVTRRRDLYDRLHDIQADHGAVPSPFDCYLAIRGLKTLHIRMREHMRNAQAVAEFLEGHPLVEKVIYPGLSSYPQKELCRRQCTGFSGMVSFYIKGGKEMVEKFTSGLRIVTLSGSLGMPDSLILYPVTISHASLTEEERQRLDITESLVRMSIGLEDKEDLIKDIDQAFKNASETKVPQTGTVFTD